VEITEDVVQNIYYKKVEGRTDGGSQTYYFEQYSRRVTKLMQLKEWKIFLKI
jgi:hypothetical protein